MAMVKSVLRAILDVMLTPKWKERIKIYVHWFFLMIICEFFNTFENLFLIFRQSFPDLSLRKFCCLNVALQLF